MNKPAQEPSWEDMKQLHENDHFEVIELTRTQRMLCTLGGLAAAGAAVASVEYLPYDAHEDISIGGLAAGGMLAASGVALFTALRGRWTTSNPEQK